MKIIYIPLDVFKTTGGIQSFNKSFLKSLSEIAKNCNLKIKCLSLYDDDYQPNEYVSIEHFVGFKGYRIKFLLLSIYESRNADKVIFGHINLSILALIIKIILRRKILIVTHGVEVWNSLSFIKKYCLLKSDLILSVSEFTKNQIAKNFNLDTRKIIIFRNTLDPYFKVPTCFDKSNQILQKYNISKKNKILLTVCRLSSEEKYKGYDRVIKILPDILVEYPDVKYLIVGKGDLNEIERVSTLIKKLKLNENVILIGYVTNKELIDFYLSSDVFILPSKGEGFGIVIIEALACGRPVIVGNKDGSKEAVMDGKLGTLIDPEDENQLKDSILRVLNKSLNSKLTDSNYLSKEITSEFGFPKFNSRLKEIINYPL